MNRDPPIVLKPGVLSAEESRNWRPQVGMARSTQRAGLDQSGHRTLGHHGFNRNDNRGGRGGGYQSNRGSYNNLPPYNPQNHYYEGNHRPAYPDRYRPYDPNNRPSYPRRGKKIQVSISNCFISCSLCKDDLLRKMSVKMSLFDMECIHIVVISSDHKQACMRIKYWIYL